MNPGRFILGLILIIIGLSALFNINIWHIIWPLFIIAIGIRIFTGSSHPGDWQQWHKSDSHTTDQTLDDVAIFNELKKKVETDNFTGGKITIVFGGGEIDLTKVNIPVKTIATVEVNVIFGGIKLIVPKNWSVNSSVVGVMGGFTNHTITPAAKEEKGRLYIKGSAVFGGGDVVNT